MVLVQNEPTQHAAHAEACKEDGDASVRVGVDRRGIRRRELKHLFSGVIGGSGVGHQGVIRGHEGVIRGHQELKHHPHDERQDEEDGVL